jgi:hypothetical protein
MDGGGPTSPELESPVRNPIVALALTAAVAVSGVVTAEAASATPNRVIKTSVPTRVIKTRVIKTSVPTRVIKTRVIKTAVPTRVIKTRVIKTS